MTAPDRDVPMDIPVVDLKSFLIDPEIVRLVPEEVARRHTLIPLFRIKNTVTVAIADPYNVPAIDEVERHTQCQVDTVLANREQILAVIDQQFGHESVADLVRGIDTVDNLETIREEKVDVREVQKIAEEPPLIRLVNLIILKAIDEGASDIHIEPSKDRLRVRYRLDGKLHEVQSLPRALHVSVAARLKIMSSLDIIERRRPQDGRITVKVRNREVDLRVSTFPTNLGEKIVIRVLDKDTGLLNLEGLGFPAETMARVRKLIRRPNGIFLVTGPTGSGKTSTLYAALHEINAPAINIITLEDPVEYQLEGINQGQINPGVGLTFADGLRAILRQDPNVIFVGEIRDLETAEIAVRASLTGHLVFSTLHTNDAPSTVTRLMDIGIQPYLLSSSLLGILAQRLVRRICQECIEPDDAAMPMAQRMGITLPPGTRLMRGRGCDACRSIGYKGRVGIFELLDIIPEIGQLIAQRADTDTIRQTARQAGMRSLRDDGVLKAAAGQTTLEEVLSITQA